MKIKLTNVYVDDQEKALRFYTEVLGFTKKADFSQGPFRWLTVASPEEPEGTQLQLALNNNPTAKAYQQAMFQQGHRRSAPNRGTATPACALAVDFVATACLPVGRRPAGTVAVAVEFVE